MATERIGGKGQPTAPPPPATRVGPPEETGKPFELESPRALAPTQGPLPIPATRTALERYRAGELDLDGYLDLKVDEATAHLGALPAQDLEAIRGALRDRLASDPTLMELVQTATGRFPEPPGET